VQAARLKPRPSQNHLFGRIENRLRDQIERHAFEPIRKELIVAKKQLSVENNVTVEKPKETTAEEKPTETTVEFLSSLAAVLVTGLFIITFVVQAFEIPSSSMENTLLIGDHVFVNRIQFAPRSSWVGPLLLYRDVHFRDIVVFLSPAEPGLYVVKRIIGLPGDRIHLRNGVVYRNGEALDEPYVLHDRDTADPYRNNFPAVSPTDDPNVYPNWMVDLQSYIHGDDIVVPPDHYFAMGDHRGVSLDSRYWGFIPKANVIGRPMFIYWSFETPDDQYRKTAWGDRILFMGKVVLHFFDETRWKRTLQFVR
jgi:signal peptidase I